MPVTIFIDGNPDKPKTYGTVWEAIADNLEEK